MVKRYRVSSYSEDLFEWPSGEWIKAEDYDALAARLVEVERLLRSARHMIASNICHYANDAPVNLVARIDAAIGNTNVTDANSAANRVASGIADKTAGECPERATVADRRQEDGCS